MGQKMAHNKHHPALVKKCTTGETERFGFQKGKKEKSAVGGGGEEKGRIETEGQRGGSPKRGAIPLGEQISKPSWVCRISIKKVK